MDRGLVSPGPPSTIDDPPAAILIGIAVEAVKHLYLIVWPWLDFRRAYGPFFISATLVMWGVVSSLVVLAGAEIAARGRASPSPQTKL